MVAMSGFSPQLPLFAAFSLLVVGCGDREAGGENGGKKEGEKASDTAVTMLETAESEVFAGALHERVFEVEEDSPLLFLDAGVSPQDYLVSKGAVFKGNAQVSFDKDRREFTVINSEEQLLVVEAILGFSEDPYDPLESAASFLDIVETEKFLTDTVVPKVDFDRMPFKDALAHLEDQTKVLDPEGRGIRISIDPLTTPDVGETPVTLSLKEEPLSKVLWRLGSMVHIKYMVEPSEVLFTYGHWPLSPVTNIYRVSDNFESDRLEALSNEFESRGEDIPPDPFAPFGPDGEFLPPQDIQDVMERAGISFPSGSRAVFIEGSSLLAVKNTPDQLELVEAWLTSVDAFQPAELPASSDLERCLEQVRIPSIRVQEMPFVSFLSYFSMLAEGHSAQSGKNLPDGFRFDYVPDTTYDPFGFYPEPVSLEMENSSLREIMEELRRMTGCYYLVKNGKVVFFSPEK